MIESPRVPGRWAGVEGGSRKGNFRDFSGGPVAKNLPSNAGDIGSILGQGAKIPRALGQLSPRTAMK